MLNRILVIRTLSSATNADLLEKLQITLSAVAARVWPAARVETIDVGRAEDLVGLDLEAEDLLFVPAGDVQILDRLNEAAQLDPQQPSAVLLTADGAAGFQQQDGGVVHGTLHLDELVPENVALAINNALASRVRTVFMRRLKMRDSRRDNSIAAPITSLPSAADEWLPTQVFTRSADEQFPQAYGPTPASSAGSSSTLTDYGAKALGYNILSHLARGGVADVFLAERAADGTAVVLKIIDRAKCDDPSAVKRFIQEYTLASRIRSPHVVQIFDRGFTPAYAFISMEYFAGGDLTRQIRAGIDPTTVICYMKQIAQGLFEIHKQGIAHRDMKPGNVLFRADGTVVITDFGIAKLVGSSATLTLDNVVVGTPYYTAPELITGQRCDVASDLYSLGVMFFEMLTGEKPYTRKNIQEILSATVSAPVPTLPAALAEFQPVLDRLMAKKPSDRFASAKHLLDALSTFRGLQKAPRAGSNH
jgi:hypothetical protein